jgi:hypothetical protein
MKTDSDANATVNHDVHLQSAHERRIAVEPIGTTFDISLTTRCLLTLVERRFPRMSTG